MLVVTLAGADVIGADFIDINHSTEQQTIRGIIMNSFSVSSCAYDGTSGGSGDPNPLCTIQGTVNGLQVFPQVFFAYLMAANAAGQMQQALTAVLFNWYASVYGFLQNPWPSAIPFPLFPFVGPKAIQVQGPFPVPNVSVPAALIGSWTA
jgi:hypothetical protein